MTVRALFTVLALHVVFTSHAASAQAARLTRTKSGDTTVLVTNGVGPWGPVHDAVEIKRIDAETKESTFGSVNMLTATADGGVALFDTKSLDGPIIRRFDADGKFVRNLGRRGSGPGEYELGPMNMQTLMLTARTDGSVIVREGSRAVLRYGADGAPLNTIMLYHNNGSTNEVVAANDGTVWIRAAFVAQPGGGLVAGQRPMMHYDGNGKLVDSLVQGAPWLPAATPPGTIREWWAPIPDGRVMITRTDKVGFLLTDPRGSTAPTIVELIADPVRYSAEERKELEALEDFTQAMPRRGPPPARRVIGETKPLSQGASVDIDGRIWVARPGPGQKTKPRIGASYGGQSGSGQFMTSFQDQIIYTAFRADGTLLGEVRFPAGVRPTFIGNTAWGMVKDQDDTPILVKYKLY